MKFHAPRTHTHAPYLPDMMGVVQVGGAGGGAGRGDGVRLPRLIAAGGGAVVPKQVVREPLCEDTGARYGALRRALPSTTTSQAAGGGRRGHRKKLSKTVHHDDEQRGKWAGCTAAAGSVSVAGGTPLRMSVGDAQPESPPQPGGAGGGIMPTPATTFATATAGATALTSSSASTMRWALGAASPTPLMTAAPKPVCRAGSPSGPLPPLLPPEQDVEREGNSVSASPRDIPSAKRSVSCKGRMRLVASSDRWQTHREALLAIGEKLPQHRGSITRAVEEFDRHIDVLASQASYRPIVVSHTAPPAEAAVTVDAGTSTDADVDSLAFQLEAVPQLRELLFGGTRVGLASRAGLEDVEREAEVDAVSESSDEENPYQSLSLRSYLPVEKTDAQKRTEQLEMLSKLLLWGIHERDAKVKALAGQRLLASQSQAALVSENTALKEQLMECKQELAKLRGT